MVDITQRPPQTSPPDRLMLSQITKEPKLIRYLENLFFDISQTNPENVETLLDLIVDAGEQAGKAQGTANIAIRLIADLQRLALSMQPGDPQAIGRLSRKMDEIEARLLDVRPAAPQTPAFAPAFVTATTTLAVLSRASYQPFTVRADATAAAFTVTLPAAPQLLQLVNIKKIDATANIVTVSGGAINIDGGLTVGIASQYTNLQVQYNGATWDVL